jgi:ATP-dependent DNA helicase RecQ
MTEQIAAEGVGACEKRLESAGVLERLEATENMAAVRLESDLPTLVDLLPQQAKVRRQVLRAVEQIVGPQRRQWCYFQPRELAARLPGFDTGDLGRHLRELTALAAFDYVPPFRGRAIHLRERGRSFEDLSIDFESLERRKAIEYEKLERMLAFARAQGCRQAEILSYFGQEDSEPCQTCDNCQQQGRAAKHAHAQQATGGVLEAVRMVLSGVARVSRSRSGCGKQLLAQMLCGSQAKPVVRNRLDKLSTFGLLAHLKQPEVVQLIDALLVGGLVEQVEIEPFRPVLRLTDRGTEVMSGADDATARLSLSDALWRKLDPTHRKAARTAPDNSSPSSIEPPVSRPAAEVEAARAVEAPSAAARPTSSGEHTAQPSHYWTWRLLSAGFTPADCAAIRSLAPEVVLDHALRAAEAGWAIDAKWFLSSEVVARIEAVVGPSDPERIRPLLARLPRGTRYEEVQLVLKARRAQLPRE